VEAAPALLCDYRVPERCGSDAERREREPLIVIIIIIIIIVSIITIIIFIRSSGNRCVAIRPASARRITSYVFWSDS
jgi:hypothetical protein